MKQVLIPAAFNPAASAVDFSNIAGFNPTRLLAIINASAREIIFDPTTNGLGLAAVSGAHVTLQANVSTQLATDRVLAFYDDGQSPATAASQPALSPDGGALSHVTNFPTTQVVSGVVTANDGGAAISGTAMPSGGSGLTGWLSAIWAKLSGTLSVSWTGQSVGVASLPALPAGSNVIGAVTQSGAPWSVTVGNTPIVNLGTLNGAATDASLQALKTALGSPFQAGASIANTVFGATQSGGWTVSVANFPSTQNVSDLQSAPCAGAVAMTVGASYAAQRSLGVLCTVAGAIQIQFSDASTLILPVGVGWQTFPFAVTQVLAAGTTATATYFNLK
jgi:hypothetical protein